MNFMRCPCGLAARNYALVQVMLQAGLRVGEMAALRVADITLSDRSGVVRIRHGKGLKAREVPLNASGSYFQSPRRRADIAPEPVMA